MSALFGNKKQRGSLIALIDIESGSVGSALAYVEKGKRPKLFAQRRESTSTRESLSAEALFKEIEREFEASLANLNGVALRMQGATGLSRIDRGAVFLHSPWVSTHIALEKVLPKAHDPVLDALRASSRGYFDETPISFHSFATTTTPVVHGLFSAPQDMIVCSIGSEVSELSYLRDGKLMGHATTPVGLSTIIRTISSHAGVSAAEAHSIVSLSRSTMEHAWSEAAHTAIKHFAREVRDAIGTIPQSTSMPSQVFVLSPRNSSDWFAKSLTNDSLIHELFYPGSTIRAIGTKHVSPQLSGHPTVPDLPLMLESLFVDTRFGA